MKENKSKRFNENSELNISDVSVQSKHSIGDRVKIKHNLDDIIGVSGMYLSKGPKHPLYKTLGDNDGMNVILVDEISGDNRKHPVRDEFTYLSKSNRNGTGFLYDLEDEDLPIINDYLISNFGYKKGERIIFWMSW